MALDFDRLDFDRIVRRTLTVLAANIVPFGLAAVLLVGLPSYLLRGTFLDSAVLDSGFGAGFSLSGLILMAAQIILSGFVIHATALHLRGTPATLEQSLRHGLQVVLSVWLTALLLWLIFGVGMLLLIIPYFVARMVLFVTIPVAVLEQAGPVAALSRSAELTRGHRWALLGYTIVIWVLGLLAGWAVRIILGLVDLGGFGSAVTAALLAAFDAVAVTVIYRDLCTARDGSSDQNPIKVFS